MIPMIWWFWWQSSQSSQSSPWQFSRFFQTFPASSASPHSLAEKTRLADPHLAQKRALLPFRKTLKVRENAIKCVVCGESGACLQEWAFERVTWSASEQANVFQDSAEHWPCRAARTLFSIFCRPWRQDLGRGNNWIQPPAAWEMQPYPVLHLARYSKILVHHHDATIWRFPKAGYPKLAGWFISWKKTKKMMIWRSYDLGNLHQKRSGFCIPQDFHDSERPFAHCPVASWPKITGRTYNHILFRINISIATVL